MINGHSEGGTYTATVEGELNIYTAAESATQLRTAIENHDTVILDLSMVEEIDTAGIQLLIQMRRTCSARNRNLVFVRPSPPVSDAVRLLWLHEFLGMPQETDAAAAGSEERS